MLVEKSAEATCGMESGQLSLRNRGHKVERQVSVHQGSVKKEGETDGFWMCDQEYSLCHDGCHLQHLSFTQRLVLKCRQS